jgi:ribosomal protein S18 acetylase RimI-like enzyme
LVKAFFSESLGKHDRSAFASGNAQIDTYFRQTVSQDIKRDYATCYVLVESASRKIAGFYTLSSYSIPLTELSAQVARKLPRYPSVPAVLIGWLGRDDAFRGRRLGALLLADAIARVSAASIGVYALCAHAIDSAAADFYRKHQFQPFISRPNTYCLPMKTAVSALGKSAAKAP